MDEWREIVWKLKHLRRRHHAWRRMRHCRQLASYPADPRDVPTLEAMAANQSRRVHYESALLIIGDLPLNDPERWLS